MFINGIYAYTMHLDTDWTGKDEYMVVQRLIGLISQKIIRENLSKYKKKAKDHIY